MAASIFLKDCPECAAANPVEAVRCSCGYRFDCGRADTTVDGLELIAREEKLYCDYLAARVQQAAKELEHARAVANAFPGDKLKAAERLLAEQRYHAARAELEAQNLRAQAIAARAKSARKNSSRKRVTTAVAGVPQIAKPAAPKPVPPTPPPARSHPAPEAEPVRQTDRALPASTAEKADPAPRRPIDPDEPLSHRQAAASQAEIPAPTAASQLPVRAVTPVRPKAAKPVLAPARPAAAAKPPAAKRPAPSPDYDRVAATPAAGSPIPSPVFRAQQSERAQTALVASQQNATKECPNCTASVPLKTSRCRCGFEFPDGQSQIPPLLLSAEERNAILKALSGLDHKR